MSTAVRRRLEVLERSGGMLGEPLLLLVQFVRPGETDAEISSLRRWGGASIERGLGESQSAFVKRAAALERGPDGVPVVLFAGP